MNYEEFKIKRQTPQNQKKAEETFKEAFKLSQQFNSTRNPEIRARTKAYTTRNIGKRPISRGRGSRRNKRSSNQVRTVRSVPRHTSARSTKERFARSKNVQTLPKATKFFNKLAQRSDVGILGPFTTNTPFPKFETTEGGLRAGTMNSKKFGQDGCRLVGTEFIGTISIIDSTSSDATLPGAFLFVLPINPLMIQPSRLSELSALFQRYCFRSYVIELIPVIPATQNGSLIAFTTYDVDEPIFTWGTGEVAEREALAHKGAVMTQVFERTVFGLTNVPMTESYFTGHPSDTRLENQGMVCVMSASSFTSYTGLPDVTLCNIMLHYDVEFYIRTLHEIGEIPVTNYLRNMTGLLTGNWLNLVNSQPAALYATPILPTGSDTHINSVFSFRVVRSLQDQTTSTSILVNTPEKLGIPFNRGSVFWGFLAPYSGGIGAYAIFLCTSFEGAVSREGDMFLAQTLTGADTAGGVFYVNEYPLHY